MTPLGCGGCGEGYKNFEKRAPSAKPLTIPRLAGRTGSGMAGTPIVERYRGSCNPLTPHACDQYGSLLVVTPGPSWTYNVIVPNDGQTIVALGGERILAYTTPDGGVAQGFELRPGDRATRVRSGLPFHLADWEVERAGEHGS
jgi:hypothetical protein